jgi:hypothetical protein
MNEHPIHRTADTIEMRHGSRKITYYPDEDPPVAVLVWGDSMNEMAEHPVVNPVDLLDAMLWLLGEEIER